jgi:hypothetical protein
MELFLVFVSLVREFKFSVPSGTKILSEKPTVGVTNTPQTYRLVVEKR